jgi:hypothetical protein
VWLRRNNKTLSEPGLVRIKGLTGLRKAVSGSKSKFQLALMNDFLGVLKNLQIGAISNPINSGSDMRKASGRLRKRFVKTRKAFERLRE